MKIRPELLDVAKEVDFFAGLTKWDKVKCRFVSRFIMPIEVAITKLRKAGRLP